MTPAALIAAGTVLVAVGVCWWAHHLDRQAEAPRDADHPTMAPRVVPPVNVVEFPRTDTAREHRARAQAARNRTHPNDDGGAA